MENAYIQFENLTVGYEKTPVISNMNLKIKKGEIVALIGPNGAGKSTILKTMARQLQPLTGCISLEGRKIQDYSFKDLSKKMAVILTERIKVELLTCHDIVATGRYPYTGRLGILTKEDEQIVSQALQTVHALELADKDYNETSDGQKQRILLARAIAQEPELILLDEPTSFLDVRHKLELLSILTRMARQKNITVITSLHEIDLAEKVADKIITVKGQDEFGCGKAEEIFQEENIRKLYDIDNGFFDPLLGNIELQKPSGTEAKVFVISEGTNGIPVYRILQRENIPFAAGILSKSDVDYRLARLYATEVLLAPARKEIGENLIQQAIHIMSGCKYVIDAGAECTDAWLLQLRKAAQDMGKLRLAEELRFGGSDDQ